MSKQKIIEAAKAATIAYNKKDWDAVRTVVTPGFVYDEVGTRRKTKGVGQLIEVWQGWAKAMPNSKATFKNVFTDGNTVVLEVTWRGTQTGPLQSPGGEIPATGKAFEIRACQVVQLQGGKARTMRHYFDMMALLQQLGVVR